MASVQETVTTYGAAWNEPDSEKRLALLAQVWSAESRYIDPRVDVTGPEALSGYIGAVQDAMLVLKGELEEHHGHLRFNWALVDEAGAECLPGVDFVTLAEDGRLAKNVGLFDRPVNAPRACT